MARSSTRRVWEPKLGVNTEMVKKPKDLLEYVIVHEMALESTHTEPFLAILDQHYPGWRRSTPTFSSG